MFVSRTIHPIRIITLQIRGFSKVQPLFYQEGGENRSFWHDVPLRNGQEEFNFVCEIPKM